MARYVVAGSTGQSFTFFLQDRSSGDGVISMTTDKVKAAYAIGTSGAVTTFALQSTTRAASWVSGGWVENSSVEMPGIYRLDVPDASLASTPSVVYTLRCSTASQNFIPVALEVQVVSSGGSDMPVNIVTYKGQSQTSVDIGAMLSSVNAKVTSVDSRLTSMDTMLTSVNAHVTSADSNVALIKAETTAIKAKTDSLAFTVAGKVDSNIHYVNGVQVQGTGTTVDTWRPV